MESRSLERGTAGKGGGDEDPAETTATERPRGETARGTERADNRDGEWSSGQWEREAGLMPRSPLPGRSVPAVF
jgi:hypothetical protein